MTTVPTDREMKQILIVEDDGDSRRALLNVLEDNDGVAPWTVAKLRWSITACPTGPHPAGSHKAKHKRAKPGE